ncbi:uncharacterized protein LOC125560702 [Nematostella vectensis]|uniref:uncharacterized protein LOC125560702 n=1 Tax=Nematostella vectensis TaxID=45351 RepID=UPI002076DF1E|nr:uncharacterized protein LOC125560702 [Nematostella vectensis]
MAAYFCFPAPVTLYVIFFFQTTLNTTLFSTESEGSSSTILMTSNEPLQVEFNLLIHYRRSGQLESHGMKYLSGRIKRCPNSTSTFQLTRIAVSGDVSPNPGPSEKCSVCLRTIARNHRAVLCDCCKGQSHIKCVNVKPSEYKRIKQMLNDTWICPGCAAISTQNEQPFQGIGDASFEELFNMNVHGDPAVQDEDEARYANDLPEPWITQERKRNSTDLMLIHLNINSCQNKLDELLLLNKELRSHVIFLTETKIDSSYTNAQLALEGYHIYRKDRKKGGGGLMAYFSSKMASRKVKLPKQYKLLEVLAINAIINNNNVLFVGIYRSPNPAGTDYYRKLEEELHAVCMWASMECNTLVLTGDLNLDRLRPERREGQILINLEEVFGLECLIKDPTRVTPTSDTLLDVILTNKPELFRASGVLNPEMSDHHLVYGIMKERVSQHERKVVTFRSTKSLDVEKFNEDLSSAPWHVMETFDTMDDKYHYWETLFNTIVEKHMPTKKMRFRKADVPYMTPEWKQAIKMKRKFAKQYAHSKTEENWELKRKWRNKATNCRRKAIKEYWQQKADDLKAKPSEFYKTFRPFLSDKKQLVCEINIRTDGKIEKDQEKVANVLVDYFSTMANEIGGANVNSLTEEDLSSHPSLKNIYDANKSNNSNFCFQQLSTNSVQSFLEKLNVRKASGYDSITPRLLKLASRGIADSLTGLYNECIRKGEWPEAWKKGEWNPVYKKDDRLERKNYRPITLLCIVDKVYESMMSTQVNNHFDPKLDPCLSAYRKKHSCETTLLKLTEDWKLAVDSKQFIGILSTDMSKAFDSLHPALMVNKLKAYGFSEQSLHLMRSYFTNRQNRVKLNGVTSVWKDAVRGCPQGSSFGPLLWNIFQNDMTFEVKTASLSMYADDHQLYVKGGTAECVEQILNFYFYFYFITFQHFRIKKR